MWRKQYDAGKPWDATAGATLVASIQGECDPDESCGVIHDQGNNITVVCSDAVDGAKETAFDGHVATYVAA